MGADQPAEEMLRQIRNREQIVRALVEIAGRAQEVLALTQLANLHR